MTLIAFEGGDGVGKSTQLPLLVDHLTQAGHEVVATRQPGGTDLGQLIRRILLDPASGDIPPRAEALLYLADKADHVASVIEPALARGAIVVTDRYVDSMLAYQGQGRSLDVEELQELAEWAVGGRFPDLTILLDMDPDDAVGVKQNPDRLEGAGAAFHRRVRESFLDLADEDPDRYLVLPARTGVEGLAATIAERVDEVIAHRDPREERLARTLAEMSERYGKVKP